MKKSIANAIALSVCFCMFGTAYSCVDFNDRAFLLRIRAAAAAPRQPLDLKVTAEQVIAYYPKVQKQEGSFFSEFRDFPEDLFGDPQNVSHLQELITTKNGQFEKFGYETAFAMDPVIGGFKHVDSRIDGLRSIANPEETMRYLIRSVIYYQRERVNAAPAPEQSVQD